MSASPAARIDRCALWVILHAGCVEGVVCIHVFDGQE